MTKHSHAFPRQPGLTTPMTVSVKASGTATRKLSINCKNKVVRKPTEPGKNVAQASSCETRTKNYNILEQAFPKSPASESSAVSSTAGRGGVPSVWLDPAGQNAPSWHYASFRRSQRLLVNLQQRSRTNFPVKPMSFAERSCTQFISFFPV